VSTSKVGGQLDQKQRTIWVELQKKMASRAEVMTELSKANADYTK
jgi:hypothetical protein